MKIYTKTGDNGTTGLLGGTRVSKANLRIDAYGTVDELNSYLGLLRDQTVNKHRVVELINIQNILFIIGSYLASDPDKSKVKIPELNPIEVEALEKRMDEMNEKLPEMRNFVLPGGHESVSYCHITRCVCRRAERLVTGLSEVSQTNELVLKYLNRLSDYLFVLSRMMTQELNATEIPWLPKVT
jgi:cob(I)alamin adenosyltransferase